MKRFRTAALGALAVCMCGAQPAPAQTFDHLYCFKARDEKVFKSAAVDLDPSLAAFAATGCTIKAKAKEVCLPATASVTAVEDGTHLPIAGPALTFERLCYKLKCPKFEPAPETFSDAFGTRELSRFRATKICLPAVGGAISTTTTTTSSTTTTTVDAGLSDDFDGVALDPSWTVLNGALATLSVSGGQLIGEALANSVWFNDSAGILIHKDVTGDFDVRTTLHVRKTSNAIEGPDTEFRLGGILARDPASAPGARNTVHVALGAGSVAVPTASEDKSTDDSTSTFLFHAAGSFDGELRLVRSGSTFTMYHRAVGAGTWDLIGTHVRADLPATLQVGPMLYDNSGGGADLTVSFDDIVFVGP